VLQQPNPWILLMGGIALINVSMAVAGAHAPAWVRYGGMAVCIALGLTSMGLGIYKYFNKKPPPPRFVSRRQKAASGRDPRV
jgi:hypothetical protein